MSKVATWANGVAGGEDLPSSKRNITGRVEQQHTRNRLRVRSRTAMERKRECTWRPQNVGHLKATESNRTVDRDTSQPAEWKSSVL